MLSRQCTAPVDATSIDSVDLVWTQLKIDVDFEYSTCTEPFICYLTRQCYIQPVLAIGT
jgi:hypothetical protein